MSMNKAIEYVSAGVKFLDSVKPGWADKISLNKLNMEAGDDCILGQLYGMFETGLGALSLNSEKSAKYGFEDDYRETTYPELNKAWKNELTLSLTEQYVRKSTGNTPVDVKSVFRLDGTTHVVYRKVGGIAPEISTLSWFRQEYKLKTKNWERGTILRAANGKLFMVAAEGRAWRLSDTEFGSSYVDFSSIEKDHGALEPVTTKSGRTLVGGMELHS